MSELKQPTTKYAELKPGQTIRVHQIIKEKNTKGEDKERVQVFEGIIISRKHGNGLSATITVRKTTGGYGVEKILPLRLPTIEKIEVIKRSKTVRAKLYYLRDKTSREIRRKTKQEAFKAKTAPKVAEEVEAAPTE